jgi:hypothetical protein
MVRTGVECHHKIQRFLARYSIPLDIPDFLPDIQKALRSTQKSLCSLKLQAAQEHQDLLQHCIAEAHAHQDSKKHRSAKRVVQANNMKGLHVKLGFLLKEGDHQSCLAQLEVPTDPTQDPKRCTDWTIDTPEEITRYLLERNQKHFRQA